MALQWHGQGANWYWVLSAKDLIKEAMFQLQTECQERAALQNLGAECFRRGTSTCSCCKTEMIEYSRSRETAAQWVLGTGLGGDVEDVDGTRLQRFMSIAKSADLILSLAGSCRKVSAECIMIYIYIFVNLYPRCVMESSGLWEGKRKKGDQIGGRCDNPS